MDDPSEIPTLFRVLQRIAAGHRVADHEATIVLEQVIIPVIKKTLRVKSFFSEVTGLDEDDLCGDLWEFASTPGPKSGKTLWQKALENAAASASSPVEEDNRLKSYLMLSFDRHLKKTLMKGSTAEAAVSLVTEACAHGVDFQLSKHKLGAFHADILPVGSVKDALKWSKVELESLQPPLPLPTPKGKRMTHGGALFPTPLQAAELIRGILSRRSAALPVREFVDFLCGAYHIPHRTARVSFDGFDDASNEDGNPDRPLKEDLKKTAIPPGKTHTEKDEEKQAVERLCAALLDKIGMVDRKPVKEDDPGSGGKLARLLLDFLLWQNMPLRGENRYFGYEIHSHITSIPVSTLQDRYQKKLIPLLQKFCRENKLGAEELRAVFARLRKKFLNRKPENVTDPDFHQY